MAGYDGSSLVQTTAVVSGAGTNANPYTAQAAGFTTFGLFGVENTPGAQTLNIRVFPNPTAETINLTFPQKIVNGVVTITAQGGSKLVTSKMTNSGSWNMNVANYLPGLYVITLQNEGKVYTQKFMKL